MDAKAFYELRNKNSFAGRLARAVVALYQKGRPPQPYRSRSQEGEVFERYLGARGDVLILGSNLPPEKLAAYRGQKVSQLDRKPLPHVDVVADAESLSEVVPEGSYDYVVSTSMLEHTLHPWKVLEEVHKVLRPGGILYLSVPWMFPLHGEPHDYYRFSLPCLKGLTRDAGFIEIESGSEYSPHAALQTFLRTYLSEALSFNRSMAFYSLQFLTSWLLYPLGLLEGALRLGPRTHCYTDAIFYIVAQKPLAPSAPDAGA
jgi:SAM-dependent methyltransferase